MKPIETYVRQDVPNWHRLPQAFTLPHPGTEKYTAAFINDREGIHMMVTLEDLGRLQRLHVTLAPMLTLRPDLQEDELIHYIFLHTGNILADFFGESRTFLKAPDDERHPQAKHYFYILQEGE